MVDGNSDIVGLLAVDIVMGRHLELRKSGLFVNILVVDDGVDVEQLVDRRFGLDGVPVACCEEVEESVRYMVQRRAIDDKRFEFLVLVGFEEFAKGLG